MLIVASGFLLRVLGGAAATHVKPSVWFLLVCSLGRARRGGRQAVHRADQPRRGRGTAPPGDALVPARTCCAIAQVTHRGRHARDVPDVGAQRGPRRRPWHLASALPLAAALVRFGVLTARRTVRPVEDLITRDAVMLCCEVAWLALFCVGLYVE